LRPFFRVTWPHSHSHEAQEQVRRLKEEWEDDPGGPGRRQAAARRRAAQERAGRLSRRCDEQVHDRHGAYPAEALADGGFAALADLEAAQAAPRGTTVYAPVPKPKDAKSDR
jgi:hypothetical protein